MSNEPTETKPVNVGIPTSDLLADHIQTSLVFAARYTHDRRTGGALVVVRALQSCWAQLSKNTQHQIITESTGATCNQDDWAVLQSFAANVPDQPRP